MVYCPECESDLDIEEDEVDEGEVVSCPECGTDFEIVTVNPIELKPVEEEEEEKRKTRKPKTVICNRRPVAVSQNSSRIARLFLGLLLFAVFSPSFLRLLVPGGSAQTLRPDLRNGVGAGRPSGVWSESPIRRADQKKAKWELNSDHSGEFAQRLPAGKADYVVWADMKGTEAFKWQEIRAGRGGQGPYRGRRTCRHRFASKVVQAGVGVYGGEP